ncbi:MAG: CapA family protein [Clostridia bacterium]|nr:CapA family protein [Clostridia bacterium]
MKITIVGDIMCEPLLIRAAKRKEGYDFSPLFHDFKTIVGESDYVIGNLETVMAGKEERYCNDLYSFNAPDDFARAIKEAGIDLVTIANNHCLDRGIKGLARTIQVLENTGIAHCGAGKKGMDRIARFEIQGTRFTIVGGTYGTNYKRDGGITPETIEENVSLLRAPDALSFRSLANKQIPTVKDRAVRKATRILCRMGLPKWKLQELYGMAGYGKTVPYRDNYQNEEDVLNQYYHSVLIDLEKARETSDIVIFYPHAGGQFNEIPGTFSEYVIREAAKTGNCDIILASHAHVIQEFREISGIPCFFSLGNYSMSPNSYYIPNKKDTSTGLAVHVYISKQKIIRVTCSILSISEDRKSMMKVKPLRSEEAVYPNVKEYVLHRLQAEKGMVKQVNDHELLIWES